MSKPRTPRTVEAATALLQRHAAIECELALIGQARNDDIAAANARADDAAAPMLAELGEIRAVLEPWWAGAKAELTKGKRKSIELGGCVVGTKLGRAVLEFVNGDEDAALAALREHRWAKPYIHIKESVYRVAALKALESGRHAAGLRELGFSITPGEDTFFVKRAEQAGTLS